MLGQVRNGVLVTNQECSVVEYWLQIKNAVSHLEEAVRFHKSYVAPVVSNL